MKKILLLLSALVILPALAHAEPTYTGGVNGLVIGSKNQYLASGASIAGGGLVVANATQNPPIVFSAPEVASNTAYKSLVISTQSFASGTTTFTLAKGDFTDIITPRNIVIIASGTTSGTFSSTALVVGKDQHGNSVVESIVVSSYTATGIGIGVNAWSSITSISFVGSVINNQPVTLQVGCGTALGLGIQLAASAEILKVIENKALSTTYTVSAVYDTITFAAPPDGSKNYVVWADPVTR